MFKMSVPCNTISLTDMAICLLVHCLILRFSAICLAIVVCSIRIANDLCCHWHRDKCQTFSNVTLKFYSVKSEWPRTIWKKNMLISNDTHSINRGFGLNLYEWLTSTLFYVTLINSNSCPWLTSIVFYLTMNNFNTLWFSNHDWHPWLFNIIIYFWSSYAMFT